MVGTAKRLEAARFFGLIPQVFVRYSGPVSDGLRTHARAPAASHLCAEVVVKGGVVRSGNEDASSRLGDAEKQVVDDSASKHITLRSRQDFRLDARDAEWSKRRLTSAVDTRRDTTSARRANSPANRGARDYATHEDECYKPGQSDGHPYTSIHITHSTHQICKKWTTP